MEILLTKRLERFVHERQLSQNVTLLTETGICKVMYVILHDLATYALKVADTIIQLVNVYNYHSKQSAFRTGDQLLGLYLYHLQEVSLRLI